jgi:tetratricopeptide (TPR) repeat protein
MFRKNYYSILLLVALFAVGSISVSAQKTIGGKVELEKNGKKTPVEGAKIDCYRIDIKESCGSATTDATGKFTFSDIPNDATLVLALSGTGLAPQVTPNVRMDDSNSIVVTEGDGSVANEDAVRQVALTYAKEKGELTAAQKEELAALEKQREEIEAKNVDAKNKNEQVSKLVKEGNDAFNSKNYDVAIVKFEEGFQVDPEFLGSAPVFLNNKAMALEERAILAYNAGAKTKDKTEIEKGKNAATKDFKEALLALNKSYRMTSKAPSSAIVNQDSHKKNIKNSVDMTKSIFGLMNRMGISLANGIASEEDAMQVVQIYQNGLELLPGDPDVMAGLALSLYMSGEFLGSTEQKQQSLNYWTEYKKIAPKDHSQQPVADELIEVLINTDKLKAQKIDK